MSLDAFLSNAQRRAYRMALLATHKPDDALDIVQEAMTALVQHYRDKSASQWPMLFQRILQNKIMDWHRKQQRFNKVFWLNATQDDDYDIEQLHTPDDVNPASLLSQCMGVDTVLDAVGELPLRQQQAFLLRAWEGYNTADTAELMQCSTASVKTHYFRAIQRLRDILEVADEQYRQANL